MEALGLIIIFGSIALFFLPTIIAMQRKHVNTAGIVITNIFLGWTVFGWIGALIWSVWNKG